MQISHPLWKLARSLKGNQRALVYLEPLWGIPYNLFAPYATLYMFALGVKDTQIGLIASAGMIFQILFSLLGGVVTDKLGRRLTTVIFDMIAWAVSCLILAFADSFTDFLIAAAINAVLRIAMNSWVGLLAEDAKKEQIVGIFTLIYICALGAAFFSPLSGVLVEKYGLVPTMRVLYLLMSFIMVIKIIIGYFLTSETSVGLVRMQETKHLSILHSLGQYGEVIGHILKSPATLTTLGLMLVMSIVGVVNGTFWTLYAAETIGIQKGYIAVFPFIKSIAMLISFFTVIPKVHTNRFRRPMFFGFALFAASQILLLAVPPKGFFLLTVSIVVEAFAVSLISPLLDSMQIVMVNPQERSRIISLIYVMVIALSSPFGWIAGLLSSMDRRLPFVLILALLSVGFLLTFLAKQPSPDNDDNVSA
jgi:MFS family permease